MNARRSWWGICAATACLLAVISTVAQAAPTPWPAEANTDALKLTALDSDFTHDMSGACWNPTNRTFWVCNNNPGIIWALVQDSAGNWRIATNAAGSQARWPIGGDIEAICQSDFTKPVVYVMDENSSIREYDISNYGIVNQTRSWNISAICPENGSGEGPEALTFVPDEWLRREGYRNGAGQIYTSTNGMGGLMFVGSQIGGYVHVFDLKTNASTFTYLGSNLTSRAEVADLNFDRDTGKLYVWHNPASVSNFLEVAELNSVVTNGLRRLRTLIEYTGPRTGNLEGFGLVSTSSTDHWCMVTDDSNANSEGVVLYRQFHPVEDTDGDGLADNWELRYYGSTALVSSNLDTDGDGQTALSEYRAGTDPTNAVSNLSIQSLSITGANVFVGWRTAGGRTNIVQSSLNATNGFGDISAPIIILGTGDRLTNYVDLGGATVQPFHYYRVRTVP